MLVTCRQMQDAERAAFARGATAGGLMEQAGRGIAAVLRQFFPRPGTLVLYLGKGNNAGDALVAARELLADGWQLTARLAGEAFEFKELPARHWSALVGLVEALPAATKIADRRKPVVQIDGLLGIGGTGPLQGALKCLAAEMNRCRRELHTFTVAMDIPSGLNGDSGEAGESCVEADVTVTIGHAKSGLVADSAARFVGRLAVIELAELACESGDAGAQVLTSALLANRLPRRSFDLHKGQVGRVGILAGSRGFIGAAILSATGAIRGGAGLVNLIVKEDVYPIVAAKAPPEVMVKPVSDYRDVLSAPFDALAIGPGLGFASQDEVLEVIRDAGVPAVIDADALTMLGSGHLDKLASAKSARLLTPHPGEMARLIAAHPEWRGLDRRRLAEAFVSEHPRATVLLKGARTVIASSGQPTGFNTTGDPGMATGGVGDVLTGLCAALIGQGVGCHDAACLGAWLSGRAAEITIRDGGQSSESLIAGDGAAFLGRAFQDLKAGVF